MPDNLGECLLYALLGDVCGVVPRHAAEEEDRTERGPWHTGAHRLESTQGNYRVGLLRSVEHRRKQFSLVVLWWHEGV